MDGDPPLALNLRPLVLELLGEPGPLQRKGVGQVEVLPPLGRHHGQLVVPAGIVARWL